MGILIAQQFSGDVFSTAIQWMLADVLFFGTIATAILVRLIDPKKIRSITTLCGIAIVTLLLLIALVGTKLVDSWSSDFYMFHAVAVVIAITLLLESLFRLKRKNFQDTEANASHNIA